MDGIKNWMANLCRSLLASIEACKDGGVLRGVGINRNLTSVVNKTKDEQDSLLGKRIGPGEGCSSLLVSGWRLKMAEFGGAGAAFLFFALFGLSGPGVAQDLSIKSYSSALSGPVKVDVTVLDSVFNKVILDGATVTADAVNQANAAAIPSTISGFAGVQMVYIDFFNINGAGDTISVAQADALIGYVKAGGGC